MDDKLYFDTVKKDRGDYYIEYKPPKVNSRLATLNLVFPNPLALERVAELVEIESECWIKRYPVPLMAFAFDSTGSLIQIDEIRVSSSLAVWIGGHSGINKSWRTNDLDKFLDQNLESPNWRVIYRDIPFRTDSDLKARAIEFANLRRKQNYTLRTVLILWFAVIPASWATIEFLNPEWLSALVKWIGILSFVFVLYHAAKTTLRFTGYLSPSPSELKKTEEERQKDHHHNHCKINPRGFARLKAENLDNEARIRTVEEAQKLKIAV
jgi:hypothetical protein